MKAGHKLSFAYLCGGSTFISKNTLFSRVLNSEPNLPQTGLAGLRIEKEFRMQERKCSKCGSVNVYKSVGNNWHQDGLVIQTVGGGTFNNLFQTEAFLCVDCRNLDIQVLEASTMYGKQKTLVESLQISSNWRKV